MKWRLMLVAPRSGAENMARDSALMDRARDTGEAVLSVYGWSAPTLSLGRNQGARGKYDLPEIGRREMQVVRRPTGGRALLHNREVTYSVTAPAGSAEPVSQSYERINQLLLCALSAMGVDAVKADRPARTLRPGDVPCFAEPAKGELAWNGKKLVGSAQVREGGALLQHGSILIEDDQPIIASVSLAPSALPAAPAGTLHSALGRIPEPAEVAEALFRAVRMIEDADASPIDEGEIAKETAGYLDQYESEWWTWRR